MDDGNWIEWEGGECPVAGDTKVVYRMRGYPDHDEEYWQPAKFLVWGHYGHDNPAEIIAYRIVPA